MTGSWLSKSRWPGIYDGLVAFEIAVAWHLWRVCCDENRGSLASTVCRLGNRGSLASMTGLLPWRLWRPGVYDELVALEIVVAWHL